jgi:hypothetical protein
VSLHPRRAYLQEKLLASSVLEIEITVDDPKAYTRPWTVSMNQEIRLDTELIAEFCLENEKSSQRLLGPR